MAVAEGWGCATWKGVSLEVASGGGSNCVSVTCTLELQAASKVVSKQASRVMDDFGVSKVKV